MKTILITGARGFIGRNLSARLAVRDDVTVLGWNHDSGRDELREAAARADVVFHLAGVNRPENPEEFEAGNVGLTRELCERLAAGGRRPKVVFSSSTQAALDNPYGLSKRRAEEVLAGFARETGSEVAVYRLKNVFGKWCRPNYNSVVATFCHNTAHDLPIQVNDPDRAVELVSVDDVADEFIRAAGLAPRPAVAAPVGDAIPSYSLTLGDLADRIRLFRGMRQSLVVPDFSEPFDRQLYATYLSYVEPGRWEYGLNVKSDDRGNLAEFIKSPAFGQVFVSRTKPGVTRGNHYHHTKTEKFFVIAGEGLIRFRRLDGREVFEFPVKGEDYRVVDIPPGYTHSITNTGAAEMITLFWSSEVFDPARPDTYFLPVDPGPSTL